MPCAINSLLWREYREAAEAWSRSTELLGNLTASEVVQRARDLMTRAKLAKKAYEKHLAEHGCADAV